MLAALLLAAGLAPPASVLAQGPQLGIESVDYDLGIVEAPADNPKGPVPVRLWGAIAVPVGPGPHPVVLVSHGRHGDGCPKTEDDAFTWPCFETEQRNDLGLSEVTAAIAARGAIALSLDQNAAYTFGWGEPSETRRWRWIARRTLSELEREASDGAGRFGVELAGRVDPSRLGLLGHSRSGVQVVRFAARVGASSLFLLAPAAGARLPDVPTAVILASCDGDLGNEGRRYLSRARRDRKRSRPVVQVTLRKANHNYFNRTLSELGVDDSIGTGRVACRPRRRLTANQQRRWLDSAAADFFAAELVGAERPGWLRRRGGVPKRIYRRSVRVDRLLPR